METLGVRSIAGLVHTMIAAGLVKPGSFVKPLGGEAFLTG